MKISELKEKNPWVELTKKIKANDYNLIKNNSLESDYPIIDLFNQNQKDDYKMRISMLPAHFTGNILSSKIVLLASNPGYVPAEEKSFYSHPKFIKQRIDDLTFSNDHFLSNNAERKEASPYWHNRLEALSNVVGFNNVSKHIALLQFLPYHSTKFRKIAKKYFKEFSGEYLNSQNYGFELLKNRMDEDTLIVVLRSKKAWFDAVPQLNDYEKLGRVITIKNKRQPYMTPNNFERENDFSQLISALKISK